MRPIVAIVLCAVGCALSTAASAQGVVKLPEEIEFKGPVAGPPQTVVLYGVAGDCYPETIRGTGMGTVVLLPWKKLFVVALAFNVPPLKLNRATAVSVFPFCPLALAVVTRVATMMPPFRFTLPWLAARVPFAFRETSNVPH